MRHLGIFVCLSLLGVFSPALTASSDGFDELLRQYEQGERVFYDEAAARQFVKELQQQLPANDEPRRRRLERESCLIEYLTQPAAGVTFASRQLQDPALAGDYLSLSYFYQCRANHLGALGQTKRQQEDLEQALALANGSENVKAQADVLGSQAEFYSTRGQHAEALIRLFKAYELYQQLGNRHQLGLTIENIATAFRRMGEYDKAIEYLETSEREFVAANDSYRLAFVLQQKAFVFGEMGKTRQAHQLMLQVRQIYQQVQNRPYALAALIDLLWINNLEQKYAVSMEMIGEIEREIASLRQQDPQFRPFNDVLYQLYQAEALAEYGELNRGLQQFAVAEQAMQADQNPRYLLMLKQAWSRAEARAGHYEKAYQLLQEANALREQQNAQAKLQRESLLRYQFDTDLQTQKNSQLQAQNKLTGQQLAVLEAAQRWQYIAIVLFVLLAFSALVYAVSQIRRNKRLQKLALTDELTQVGNRRAILAYCEKVRQQALSQPLHWCLLIVDIDFFKQCNDSYGHEAGDEVLCEVAALMQSLLRSQDRIGRSGGEEFLLVLPDTSEPQALEIAERLRSGVAALQFPRFPGLAVQISIGLTQAGRREELREIIARADQALYRAKANGRNQVQSS